MRHKIWEKEDFFNVGGHIQIMDPTVVELPTDGIPLVWQFDFNRTPIGIVNNIKLEDGEITGEVDWHDDQLDDSCVEALYCRLGGYYNGVETIEEGDHLRVLKCRLRGVSMVLQIQMPGAKL